MDEPPLRQIVLHDGLRGQRDAVPFEGGLHRQGLHRKAGSPIRRNALDTCGQQPHPPTGGRVLIDSPVAMQQGVVL